MVSPLQVAVGLKSFELAQILCCWGADPADVIAEFTYNSKKMTYKTQRFGDKDVQLWQVRFVLRIVFKF